MKDVTPTAIKPAHSKVGASSMHRWSECPGSVKLSEGIVQPESKYAAEGTEAHEHAAAVLEQYFFGKVVNIQIPTVEMREAIDTYFDLIKKDVLDCGKRDKKHLLVEHKFDLEKIHPGLFGTADCVLYDELKKTLRVYDFKYGAGLPVEVKGNKQLMYYGLGALLTCGFKANSVELIVVQPRCVHTNGPIRRHAISSLDMLDFSADLKDAVLATEKEGAPLKAGEHCRFCPAKINCPEITKNAQALAKKEFAKDKTYIQTDLSRALDFVPVLKQWLKSVEEFAFYEAEQGRPAPGYKLVKKRQTRKWIEGEKETHKKLLQLAKEEYFEKKLLSPAKVEKLLGKEYKDHIKELITASSSGYTLVHESDARPSKQLEAKSEFKEV